MILAAGEFAEVQRLQRVRLDQALLSPPGEEPALPLEPGAPPAKR